MDNLLQPEYFCLKWSFRKNKINQKEKENCVFWPSRWATKDISAGQLSCLRVLRLCFVLDKTQPHGTTYFGERFCLTFYDNVSGGMTHVMAWTTSSFPRKDTHCSHKPSVGLCEPQEEARINMPPTGAAQRGFTCQQFPHHCRISAKCHRHRRFFLLGSIILG